MSRPRHPTTLFDAFLQRVEEQPDAVAVVADSSPDRTGTESLRWRELAERVAGAAAWLLSSGTPVNGGGCRVCLGHTSDNTLGDVVIALASMASGRVEMPFDERLGADLTAKLWRQAGGGFWLDPALRLELAGGASRRLGRSDSGGSSQMLGWLRGRGKAIDPGAASLVLWTTGTTADPKGVTLSLSNLTGNAAAKLAAVPQSADDVRLTSLSLAHAYARTCDLGTWLLRGGTLVVTRGWEGWCRLAPRVRPTLANTVPQLASRLASGSAGSLGVDRLRLLGCGGAALSDDAFESWRARGVTVIQGYGLTEASPVICSATPEDARPGCVGRPVEGWEVEIRDQRLFVRGSHTMLGYWRDPEATRRKVDPAGWLDTGDLVSVDEGDGQFRILGRADDVIVLASGHKVHPGPIERTLQGLAGVRHAIVVASPGGTLEAWIDGESWLVLDEAFRRTADKTLAHFASWQRPRRFWRFDRPLSVGAGELTPKGTVRRDRVRALLGR